MEDNIEELMRKGLRSILFEHDWIDTECMVGILDDEDIQIVKGKDMYNDNQKPIR